LKVVCFLHSLQNLLISNFSSTCFVLLVKYEVFLQAVQTTFVLFFFFVAILLSYLFL